MQSHQKFKKNSFQIKTHKTRQIHNHFKNKGNHFENKEWIKDEKKQFMNKYSSGMKDVDSATKKRRKEFLEETTSEMKKINSRMIDYFNIV